MNKKFSILASIIGVLAFTSCNNDIDNNIAEKCNQTKKIEEMSGTIKESEFPYSINFAGKTITFENIDDNSSVIQTRAVEWTGPYYTTGNMSKILSSQKLSVRYAGYMGVYFCDVYAFRKDITVPSDAATAKIGVPSTSGFSNYTTQERGVVWNLKTDSKGIVLQFYFYTLALLHDVSGAQINRVIPIDGNKIQIPYYFGY